MNPGSFKRPADREAFTLLEMLVAMAVVALMMAFMFNMTAQAIKTWEIGGRRMESAQAARVGMNYLAGELQYAMAGVWTGAGNPTPNVTNIVPFVAISNATTIPGERSANLQFVPASDQLFFVAPMGAVASGSRPFGELGYFNVFARSTGAHTMIGQRYYLVRHGSSPGGTNPSYQDFYQRGTGTADWYQNQNNTTETFNRTPLVDNCIQVTFDYASNNNGTVSWSRGWPSQTNLPLGVLVTMRVLDAKSANRLAALRGDNRLTAQQLESLTNGQPSSDPVVRILREGTTTLRRFVPILQ
jgi:prepilin-type N-terminal cleavage/methylation domain-containing protein